MTELPQLDDSKRLEGAAKSLALRQARAFIKSQLHEQPELFPAIVMMDEVRGMRLTALLRAMPGVGKTRASTILKMAGIDESKTVRAVGPKQFMRLVAELQKRGLG